MRSRSSHLQYRMGTARGLLRYAAVRPPGGAISTVSLLPIPRTTARGRCAEESPECCATAARGRDVLRCRRQRALWRRVCGQRSAVNPENNRQGAPRCRGTDVLPNDRQRALPRQRCAGRWVRTGSSGVLGAPGPEPCAAGLGCGFSRGGVGRPRGWECSPASPMPAWAVPCRACSCARPGAQRALCFSAQRAEGLSGTGRGGTGTCRESGPSGACERSLREASQPAAPGAGQQGWCFRRR